MGPWPVLCYAGRRIVVDEAHDWTDEQIAALEDRIRDAYEQAAREIADKLKDLLSDFDDANVDMKAMVASGKMTQEEYDRWLESQSYRQAWLKGMASELAADATQVDQIAMDYINEEIPRAYCENVNYSFYEIETELGFDTHSFSLYDQKTVGHMLANPDMVRYPRAELDKAKDAVWNFREINEALTQSILQGESIPNTAKRMATIVGHDRGVATRVARTTMTSAENAGRMESYRVADKIGIKVEKEWYATLDVRTRPTHRKMHRVHVPYDKPFTVGGEYKMMYPADPAGPPHECYNCRCTLVKHTIDTEGENTEIWSNLPPNLTYEEWLEGKGKPARKKKKKAKKKGKS